MPRKCYFPHRKNKNLSNQLGGLNVYFYGIHSERNFRIFTVIQKHTKKSNFCLDFKKGVKIVQTRGIFYCLVNTK